MQCEEWDDENSELFKEFHDEVVHKNSYKSRLYELISASQIHAPILRRLTATSRWPGIKVFALCAGYAHILARLRSPLQDFCLRKGALALCHAARVTQKAGT